MTFTPDFELGLWNAWIIMVAFLAASFVPFFFGGKRADARMEGEDFSEFSRKARIGATIDHVVLMPLTLIYSLFVPLDGGWWLISGLSLSAVAILMGLLASVSFVTAPLDVPMTKGVYSISRHPMYTAGVLKYVGIGLAGTSWVFLACAVIDMIAWSVVVPEEEAHMVAKYGTAYETYVARTSRWLGIPGSKELVPIS